MERKSELLKHVRFEDARKMTEVADGAAAMVFLSPPYIDHHKESGREAERELLAGLFPEAVRVIDSKNGLVAVCNTDFSLDGRYYARHDIIREAAKLAGLGLYDDKIVVTSLKVNPYRKTFKHLQIFVREENMEAVNERNERKHPYAEDVWYFPKSQVVNGFSHTIPPEVAIIPIKNYTEPGELIVVQCSGTGTEVIAALRMGRQSIGYEIDRSLEPTMRIREADFEKYFSSEEILGWIKR